MILWDISLEIVDSNIQYQTIIHGIFDHILPWEILPGNPLGGPTGSTGSWDANLAAMALEALGLDLDRVGT